MKKVIIEIQVDDTEKKEVLYVRRGKRSSGILRRVKEFVREFDCFEIMG